MRAMRWGTPTLQAKVELLNDEATELTPEARVALAAMSRADEYAAQTLTDVLLSRFPVGRTVADGPAASVRQVLIMPVGDRCNLACSYCYEVERRATPSTARMDLDVLRRILANVMPYVSPPFLFAWHGGEPLLMGLKFFREALSLIRDAAGRQPVRLAIQTNGTLLDTEWAELFREHNVEIGLSLDGPAELHDRQRMQPSGGGSYHDVVRGIRTLRAAGLPFHVISAISGPFARIPGSAAKLFGHFKDLGIGKYDIHPVLTHAVPGNLMNLGPGEFSRFAIDLFEQWLSEGDGRIEIGFFDHFFQGMTGQSPDTCYLSGACVNVVGVGPDGAVIPCTRPFDSTYTFGNLSVTPLPQIVQGPVFRRFTREELLARKNTAACEWSSICNGGCPHDRQRNGQQSVDGININCTCSEGGKGGYPEIFSYIRTRVDSILKCGAVHS